LGDSITSCISCAFNSRKKKNIAGCNLHALEAMDSCFCKVRVDFTWNMIHPWGPGMMRSLSFHASSDHSALFSCIRLKCTRNSMLPSAPFRGDSIQPLLRNPKPSTPFVIFSRTYTLEANSFHIFA
jgi:hypothetical protein